jgi:hypothetical protein
MRQQAVSNWTLCEMGRPTLCVSLQGPAWCRCAVHSRALGRPSILTVLPYQHNSTPPHSRHGVPASFTHLASCTMIFSRGVTLLIIRYVRDMRGGLVPKHLVANRWEES